jgi:hypothetical protein
MLASCFPKIQNMSKHLEEGNAELASALKGLKDCDMRCAGRANEALNAMILTAPDQVGGVLLQVDRPSVQGTKLDDLLSAIEQSRVVLTRASNEHPSKSLLPRRMQTDAKESRVVLPLPSRLRRASDGFNTQPDLRTPIVRTNFGKAVLNIQVVEPDFVLEEYQAIPVAAINQLAFSSLYGTPVFTPYLDASSKEHDDEPSENLMHRGTPLNHYLHFKGLFAAFHDQLSDFSPQDIDRFFTHHDWRVGSRLKVDSALTHVAVDASVPALWVSNHPIRKANGNLDPDVLRTALVDTSRGRIVRGEEEIIKFLKNLHA